MDRVEFENKYAIRWESSISPDEFREDLKSMLITEIGRATISIMGDKLIADIPDEDEK